jgi:hypothetical protein
VILLWAEERNPKLRQAPNPKLGQAPSIKSQIPNKFQFSKSQTRALDFLKLVLGFYLEFVIW